MKKPSVGRVIWSCILPLLIFLGIDTVISFVAMFAISFIEAFKAGSAAMSDFGAAYNDIMNSTMDMFMKYALYFTLARCVIVVPIFFVLMNRRDKREMKEGTFVRYEKFNKFWLLLIVPLGIVACIGFNNLVMMIAELVSGSVLPPAATASTMLWSTTRRPAFTSLWIWPLPTTWRATTTPSGIWATASICSAAL